ncbi:hypothetical protein Cgig2_022342 [Carnegiea gigantea]|uniref:PB1-like domain-containing protein n=1 Tax=Carnegiea gigantea TaxID=171969 RepID=A0A9Q1KFB5_9CARY|nr:hypothetical protein Cgig2_022342 [Carnegiea gigantea]
MSVDDIVVKIHHGGKFMDGGVSDIELVDIDRLSRFEIIGLAKDIRFTNVEEFYYLIPGMSLREGLRTCHFESLDMAAIATVNKRLVVYLVHMVDISKEVVPEMPTLPYPSTATQQSNVDPMSSSFNDDQTPSPTPTPTLTLTPTSAATPIPSPTSTTQKAHSHDTTPNFNVNNEHVPEWDWKDPRPKSLIPWDKLIEGESLNEESDDSEHIPKTEVDLEAFENIAGSISKQKAKEKEMWVVVLMMMGMRMMDTDIEDELEDDVEDLETSDEEWAAARAKVAEMDIDGETNGDVPRLLRKKEEPIKVDEHTDFKKLK